MSYRNHQTLTGLPLQATPVHPETLVEARRRQEHVKDRSLAVLLAGILHALLVVGALMIAFVGREEGREPELIVRSLPPEVLERTPKKELSQASTRQRPAPPSSRATRVISAAVPTEVAVPVIEQHVEDPTALLGTGSGSFGDGFGTGGFGGGMGAGQFFGVQAKGNSFVYVVDGSSSMGRGGKWRTLKRELIESVKRLRPPQRFYVYIFSSDMVRMFDSERAPQRLEPASPEKIEEMISWLDRYDLQSGTYPRAAVAEAITKLQPDAVFLLSDGQFASGDDTEDFVLRAAKRGGRVPTVNTIAFQTESGQEVLRAIAEATGGTYRYVAR